MSNSTKFRILEFIKDFPKATNSEISKELDINKNTIRARLSELENNDYIESTTENNKRTFKINEKTFLDFPELKDELEITWYQKILKTGKTKKPFSGKTSPNIEAVTYEPNDTNRFIEMLNIITRNFEVSYIDEAGYEDRIYVKPSDDRAIYPSIKVTFYSSGSPSVYYVS